MPTNQFVPVATGPSANVYSFANWSGTAAQVTGITAGIVPSKWLNTGARQGTTMASVLGQLIVNRVGIDATDDGNVPGLLANVERGIAAMIDPSRYADDSGAVNTLVASLSPTPVALTPFLSVRVRVQFASTSTTPTLNLNGIGPKTIVRQDGSALAAGDLPANRIVNFIYDRVADVWRLGGPGPSDLLGATYITTAITKTVGGAGADFANLNLAFAWLSNYRIANSGFVTFQMAAGQFVYSASDINFQHPDGARVSIQGAPLKTSLPAGSSLQISGNGSSSSARTADTAANLATLRNVFATEIVLQGGRKFAGQGNLGNLQDILITSDGTGSQDNLIWGPGGGATFTRIASVGASYRGICVGNSYVTLAGNCYILGCNTNITSEYNGAIILLNGVQLVSLSAAGTGITASRGVIAPLTGATATLFSRGNGFAGVLAATNAWISASPGSVSSDNANAGFLANANSSMTVAGSVAGGNSSGYVASGCSSIDASNTSGTGNAGYGYVAATGANIVRTNGTATGASGAATPAVGTNGNSNAFIS